MKYEINDIFKNQNLSSEELAYWIKQFKEIDMNFDNRKFDFGALKSKKNYYNILLKYLKVNGYGYLCNKINRNMSNVELAKLLIDSNLIDKPELKFNTNLEDKIVYNKEFGLKKKYYLKYNNTFPFKINEIYYKKSKYLRCKLDKNKNKINILIDINANTGVDLKETIVIYTSLGLKEVSLSIKCESSLNSEINIKDFEEFRCLCIKNIYKAKEIFNKKEFREWLDKKGYITQVINYDEAIILSDFLENQFINFCLLNQIYINNSLDKKETTMEESYITEIEEEKIKETYELNKDKDIKADFRTKDNEIRKIKEDYNTLKQDLKLDYISKNEEKLFETKEKKSNNYEIYIENKEKLNKSNGFLSKIKGFFKKK